MNAPSPVPCHHRAADLQAALAPLRLAGQSVGFVPTMGALHAGHLALVDAALARCAVVVVSIFVNPTQFGPNEDYDRYPRTLEADLEALAGRSGVLVYAPAADDLYPDGSEVLFRLPRLGAILCGAFRPGHFEGVAQVVAKLLNQVRPDVLVLGQKDYQQTVVIGRLLAEYFWPIELVVAPTVREADGLALSSRNRYLTPSERALAPMLHQCLLEVQAGVATQPDVAFWQRHVALRLADAPEFRLEYFKICEASRLLPLECVEAGTAAVALIAAWLGQTRLIDNVRLDGV
jgi:pantoate--beta-alanine ligase